MEEKMSEYRPTLVVPLLGPEEYLGSLQTFLPLQGHVFVVSGVAVNVTIKTGECFTFGAGS